MTSMRGPSPEASGHTPGPWHLGGTFMPDSKDPRQCVWSSTPFGQQSGEVICKDARPADARLIAAAPELLATLRLFLKQWNACGPNSDFGRYFSNVRDAAEAAIHRAVQS